MTETKDNIDNLTVLETAVRKANGLPANNLIMGTIAAISCEIPENTTTLNPAMAEYLAGRFLKGIDLCGELYALAMSFEMQMELKKKREFSNAVIVRAVEHNIRTATEKKIYADADEIYLEAAKQYVAAKMFRVLLEEKKASFFKAHYLMKQILNKEIELDDAYTDHKFPQNPDTDEWTQRSKLSA